MVTGHAVFRGSLAEVMYQHQHAPLPLELLEAVPQPLVTLLEVFLEKDPARRFQSPAELLKAIPAITDAIGKRRKITRQFLPYYLALKAEALFLAHRNGEALEAVSKAEALVERSEERWCSAELHRLRGVFLAALGAEEVEIEASFGAALEVAKQQKSLSLATRAEETCAEYRRQRAQAPGERRF